MLHNTQIASNLLIFNVSFIVLFCIVPKCFPMVIIWRFWGEFTFICIHSVLSWIALLNHINIVLWWMRDAELASQYYWKRGVIPFQGTKLVIFIGIFPITAIFFIQILQNFWPIRQSLGLYSLFSQCLIVCYRKDR